MSVGHCPLCGVRDPAPGRKACLDCLDKNRLINLSRIERYKAAGRCTQCGRPAEKGHVRCHEHLGAEVQGIRTMRERRSAAGYCIECGQIRVAGTLYKNCPACREKHQIRDRKRRDKKLGVWKELPE